jgi:hypothetical protein
MPAMDDRSSATQSIGRLTIRSSPRTMRVVAPRAVNYWSILGTVVAVGILFLPPTHGRWLLAPHDVEIWFFVSIYLTAVLMALWTVASRDVLTIQPPALAVRREISWDGRGTTHLTSSLTCSFGIGSVPDARAFPAGLPLIMNISAYVRF